MLALLLLLLGVWRRHGRRRRRYVEGPRRVPLVVLVHGGRLRASPAGSRGVCELCAVVVDDFERGRGFGLVGANCERYEANDLSLASVE